MACKPIAMCTRTFVVMGIHLLHDCGPPHLASHRDLQQHAGMYMSLCDTEDDQTL